MRPLLFLLRLFVTIYLSVTKSPCLMYKTIRKIVILLIIFNSSITKAQVGIGTTSPDASSILDVSSSNKGLLLPRMSTAQRDAIATPSEGLMIYNTNTNCLEINSGTSGVPNWNCIVGESTVGIAIGNFQGAYINSVAFTASNKIEVTITNNETSSVDFTFSNSDLTLSGTSSGLSIATTFPTSVTLATGASRVVEYTLSGTPTSTGSLSAIWTQGTTTASNTTNIVNGDATFSLPQTVSIISINDGTPLVDIQGVADNGSNQLTVSIPYTSGTGAYDAYTGTYTLNNSGTGEGGDANSFRLTYPSGTFSATGNIIATIEVDGDGSFNAEKQLFGVQKAIATLDFQVNGNSKGNVNLDILGGITDRNFANANHKFIYIPVTAADGNIWLSNNLGANYANMNHIEFSPAQQASAFNDHHAYGSLFQWGRYSDGHELINYTNSSTGTGVNSLTSTNATSDTPNDNLFIIENSFPNDWRIPKNDNLWQGVNGINNPCPQDYRLPTEIEIHALALAEGITSSTTAANSSLALSASGRRIYTTGSISNLDSFGYYWFSTINGDYARGIIISGPNYLDLRRANGFAVRCIKD